MYKPILTQQKGPFPKFLLIYFIAKRGEGDIKKKGDLALLAIAFSRRIYYFNLLFYIYSSLANSPSVLTSFVLEHQSRS